LRGLAHDSLAETWEATLVSHVALDRSCRGLSPDRIEANVGWPRRPYVAGRSKAKARLSPGSAQ
jgi:hypothetical protein